MNIWRFWRRNMNHMACIAVLMCTTISHLSTTVSPQTDMHVRHYPPGWFEAPSSFEDFPVAQIASETVTVINPWLYLQRMGIFRLMVQYTQGYFNSWGYNNTGNLLWGLPLQFGWQMSSGRLSDMAVGQGRCAESLCVSPNSWWADMNYYLSVLPFLGALKAGLFPLLKHPVYISKPANVSDVVKDKFCTSIEECTEKHPEVINDWADFFAQVKGGSDDGNHDVTIALMWKAHTTSILTAQPLFTEEVSLMSLPERKFGVGWALLVEFIATTYFQTNLNNTDDQQTALPPRILRGSDKVPFIPDFTAAQNRVLLAINLFHSTNVDTKGLLLKVWRRAMCSPKGRAVGRSLLESIKDDPWIITRKLFKLLWGLFIYPCKG